MFAILSLLLHEEPSQTKQNELQHEQHNSKEQCSQMVVPSQFLSKFDTGILSGGGERREGRRNIIVRQDFATKHKDLLYIISLF